MKRIEKEKRRKCEVWETFQHFFLGGKLTSSLRRTWLWLEIQCWYRNRFVVNNVATWMFRHVTNFVDENWEVEAIIGILIRQPHFTRLSTSITTKVKRFRNGRVGEGGGGSYNWTKFLTCRQLRLGVFVRCKDESIPSYWFAIELAKVIIHPSSLVSLPNQRL